MLLISKIFRSENTRTKLYTEAKLRFANKSENETESNFRVLKISIRKSKNKPPTSKKKAENRCYAMSKATDRDYNKKAHK